MEWTMKQVAAALAVSRFVLRRRPPRLTGSVNVGCAGPTSLLRRST